MKLTLIALAAAYACGYPAPVRLRPLMAAGAYLGAGGPFTHAP